MKVTRQANDGDIWWIIATLHEATKRAKSDNFLNGFPWTSIKWGLAEFQSDDEFDNLFLFWNGLAWGETSLYPRRLKQGVQDFIAKAEGGITSIPYYEHLVDILKWRERFRSGVRLEEPKGGPALILIGCDQKPGGPFVILDGNHRAAAALWWATEVGRRDHILPQVWLGLSPDMLRYGPFTRATEAANQDWTDV